MRHALELAGLDVGAVTGNGLIMPVTATAATIEKAFASPLGRFRLPGGRIAMANTRSLLMSGAASRYVEGVIGLDGIDVAAPAGLARARRSANGQRRPARAVAPPGAGTSAGPSPCATAQIAAGDNKAYTIDQLAKAYSFDPLYQKGDHGAGVTIALFELEPYAPSDIAAYQACYRTHVQVTNKLVDGGAGKGFGSGEATLDIEVALGMASQAKLLVYEAPGSGATASVDEWTRIVTDDLAQVVSTSWGQCEPYLAPGEARAESVIFEEAAAQGQTVFSASGDAGSEDCSAAGGPVSSAGSPNAVAVDSSTGTVYSTNAAGTVNVTNELSQTTKWVIRLRAGAAPDAIAVDPLSHLVFVSARGAGSVLYFNGATCNSRRASAAGCHVSSVFLANGTEPAGLAVDARARTVYVATPAFHAVAVLSEAGGPHYVSEVPEGRPPTAVAVDPPTAQVFFTTTTAHVGYLDEFSASTCDAARTSGCAAVPGARRVGKRPAGVAVAAEAGRGVRGELGERHGLDPQGVEGRRARTLSLHGRSVARPDRRRPLPERAGAPRRLRRCGRQRQRRGA